MDSLRVGDPFPELALESIDGPVKLADRWAEGPLVVAFMRHFGCVFCREHLIVLGEAHDEIRAVGGNVVAIFQYRAESTHSFCRGRSVPFECLGDPGRGAYRAVGLGRGTWKEYLGLRVFRQRRRAREAGARQGLPRGGDVAQRPGTFVVDTNGNVVFAHYNEDSTDNPAVADVLAAVVEAASLTQSSG